MTQNCRHASAFHIREKTHSYQQMQFLFNLYLQLLVTFTKFYDPDIEDGTEKYDAVNKYEYTITDNSVQGRTYMTWTNLNSYTTSSNEVNITCLLFIVKWVVFRSLYS
jgi:hypothetical protein